VWTGRQLGSAITSLSLPPAERASLGRRSTLTCGSCTHDECEATLYLAQPVRHDNGVWVVTRVGDPMS
jgi:hypothetical protein